MTEPTDSAQNTRRSAFIVLAIVLAVGALAWALYWFVAKRHYESTDDAYVAGDVIALTSEAPGTVTAVRADDTQTVAAGDVLVELDPADARVAVAAAEATLARAAREVAALHAQRVQLAADLRSRQLVLERSARDLARREPLRTDGAVSGEELAHAADAVAEQHSAVAAATAQLSALDAQIAGTTVATHPRVLEAAAALRGALLALHRTRVTAPIAGIVAKRGVQIGQRVAPGTPLLALVSLQDAWIDANFKEVQIARIHVGQPATVHADLYGSAVTYHGHVAGLGAGSGSAFALLPAQNASGNWIKILQRLPVRIVLDRTELAAHPLRIGLSSAVEIDVAEHAGAHIATGLRSAPAPQITPAGDEMTDARIRQIIGSQSSGPAAAPSHRKP